MACDLTNRHGTSSKVFVNISTTIPLAMVKMKGKFYGVGINDADYKVHRWNGRKNVWTCPYYSTWRRMLTRCYSDIYLNKSPSYKGCQVCDSWLRFSNFRSWMENQQWIEFTDDEECNIIKKQLDKDILSGQKRGKLYSRETCVFVSGRTNSFLIDCKKRRGGAPLGVYINGEKYCAMVRNPFTKKRECLGTFTSPEIAQAFYIAQKKELAQQLAELESDPRVKEALLSIDFSH
jgi:hypothetical protein